MAAPIKLFEKAAHASLYKQFRWVFPQTVFDKILEFVHEKLPKPLNLAVDVGCGSGQSAQPLSHVFNKVIGLDISQAQIDAANEANIRTNVEYRVGSGEEIPVPDSSVELVTSFMSVHWLNFAAFCREFDRVLQPSGCVALCIYGLPIPEAYNPEDKSITEDIRKIYMQYYSNTLGPYWHERRRHIDNMLFEYKLPYAEGCRDESMEMVDETTVSSVIGYMSTWSGYQTYLRKNPAMVNSLPEFQERLLSAMRSDLTAEQTKIRLRAPVVLILGRKP